MSISDRERHCSKRVIFEGYPVIGYNYRMTDIQGALGVEQLKKIEKIVKKRREIAIAYTKGLEGVDWLKVSEEPAYCKTNWQSYPVRVLKNAPMKRDRLMQRLLDAGIATRRGIMNAHQEKAYSSYASCGSLRSSERARDEVILLPIYYTLKDSQINKVIKEIRNV